MGLSWRCHRPIVRLERLPPLRLDPALFVGAALEPAPKLVQAIPVGLLLLTPGARGCSQVQVPRASVPAGPLEGLPPLLLDMVLGLGAPRRDEPCARLLLRDPHTHCAKSAHRLLARRCLAVWAHLLVPLHGHALRVQRCRLRGSCRLRGRRLPPLLPAGGGGAVFMLPVVHTRLAVWMQMAPTLRLVLWIVAMAGRRLLLRLR